MIGPWPPGGGCARSTYGRQRRAAGCSVGERGRPFVASQGRVSTVAPGGMPPHSPSSSSHLSTSSCPP